ncbi:unnamed protein product [Caenorhabditis bovis]|uniref:C2H2-type domain-containing protein n=1 Tax=Caenorhabditis bovis TaxID=2654633 RepID=A0A8S1EDC9_9PELO|nr:unnamed protein product [Caenorhabditis bovis]
MGCARSPCAIPHRIDAVLQEAAALTNLLEICHQFLTEHARNQRAVDTHPTISRLLSSPPSQSPPTSGGATKYRNIRCVVCDEWVCARNRRNHIEAHFDYRPFACAICGRIRTSAATTRC